MGIAKKTDGRYVVGVGVENANDYKGSASYRDIYIQLTSSGATAKSEEYLTFLKDYAVNANALGEPIMPPSVNVWISNNGVTTAVEADDVSIDGNNYTICGIKWNGSAWDYTDAGKGGGGASGLPSYTSADKGKVLTVGEGSGGEAEPKWEAAGGGVSVTPIVPRTFGSTTDSVWEIRVSQDSSYYVEFADMDAFTAGDFKVFARDNNGDTIFLVPVDQVDGSFLNGSYTSGWHISETYSGLTYRAWDGNNNVCILPKSVTLTNS